MASKYLKWLEKTLAEGDVKYFDYSEFSIVRRIAQGGNGIVYLAEHRGKEVALKRLIDSIEIKKFVNELKQLSSVDHQNINKLFGITADQEKNNFIILQFANGGNLRDFLQNKLHENGFKILWSELIRIAKQIILGLEHLHDQKIIHGDLHPRNILINNDKVLIADFGSARKLNDSLITSTSSIIGVPAYMEPQCFIQLENVKIDERSDIYSLGVVLWELTSGISPFSHISNKLSLGAYIAQGHRERIIPGTPSHYSELYKRCWDSEPGKRPTLSEISHELDKHVTIDVIVNNEILRP